jgi:hypothetical protein
MAMSNFPAGFSDLISIQGLPNLTTLADTVLWVNNGAANSNVTLNGIGAGSDNNQGTFQLPYKTLAKAVANAKASKDTIIMIAPGHAETVTGTLAISVAGLKVIGLGTDLDRPTFNLTTNATATVSLTGQDALLSNVRVVDNVGATIAVTIAAKGAILDQVAVLDGTGSPTTCVSIVGGGANKADRAKVRNCNIYSAGATNGILLGEVDNQVEILSNKLTGSFSTAAIQNPTGQVLTNLTLGANLIGNVAVAGNGINVVSLCTGIMYDNEIQTVSGAMVVAGSLGTLMKQDGSAVQEITSGIKALPATTTSTVFTVTGGLVRLITLMAEVTTVVQTQANATKFTFTDTISSTATDLCTTTSITAAAVGSYIWANMGGAVSALVVTPGGLMVNSGYGGMILSPGTVVINCAATNTGAVKFRISFEPITPGASITMS